MIIPSSCTLLLHACIMLDSCALTIDEIISFLKKHPWNQAWWCTPVIPTTWEAEAGGSTVQSQPQQLSKALSNSVRPCL
uniref:Secreted protein n=1 Tax=Spermophilus dauricus TaxID=99837 RepID=A0A8C9Q7Y3_SPEDA